MPAAPSRKCAAAGVANRSFGFDLTRYNSFKGRRGIAMTEVRSAKQRLPVRADRFSHLTVARYVGASEHAMVNVLWQNRQACGNIPYHLTITTDY
jgi:hypothetical protein